MIRIKKNFRKIMGLAMLALLFTAVVLPTLAAPATQVAACTAPPWAPGEIYVGGDLVSHNGHEWRAKWWNTNEEPGTTGQYGVWVDLGPCGDPTVTTVPPTATLIPEITPTNTAVPPTSTPDTGTCNAPQYVAGTQYAQGDIVQNIGNKYQCDISGWCSLDAAWAYEPGVGTAWQDAWTYVGECNGGPTPTPTTEPPTPTATTTTEPPTPTATTTTEPPTPTATTTTEPPTPTATVPVTVEPPTPTPTTPPSGHEACRPEGLYKTPGLDVPYCDVYDTNGREDMGANYPRRIIGYFTSWRNGANGQPTYLASDIPWDKITHINYAFAHVDSNYHVSVGNVNNPANPATGMEWPGVPGAEMDPSYAYKGHFNLLNKFKQQYPQVKTLVSVGGWAETGGHFDDDGNRVDDGGFYTMTTNPNGSVNTAGINAFADSAVAFIRAYGFDGVDIDYEYPTSMADAGNPLDFAFANPQRANLMASYEVLLRTLREKLDAASVQDGRYYMLTVAAPSSGYLLRGMETYSMVQYLDYVNIMTYDLHGAWNDHVGPNAALYDTGEDSELAAWNVYTTPQYKGIGYLNTDWAYHYFRGSVPAGRINVGIPYYTRGWQGVTGGTNGLWGRAALPDQTQCPDGTGSGEKNNCGYGAVGIDNMWHDLDANGIEMGAGSNPMWHAKNLENGIMPSYLTDYGLDPVNDPQDQFVGTYTRYYENVAQAPWLWNPQKQVFLSTEDEQSMTAKVQYVIDNEIGGIMFWELAGDYAFDQSRNGGQGEYYMGSTLTDLAYGMMTNASPYGNRLANRVMPDEVVDITVSIGNFKVGDQNYPINPRLSFTNNSDATLPGGTVFQFDIPTSSPDNASDQSGGGLTVIESGHSIGNNVGGLQGDFHRVQFSLPSWQVLAPGASYDLDMVYYLPISGPRNYTVNVNGTEYAFKFEYPNKPEADLGSGGGGNSCASAGVDPNTINEYPNWTAGDHANQGDRMRYQGTVYQAKWWTSTVPGGSDWNVVCTY